MDNVCSDFNSLGDLRKNVEYLIGAERLDGNLADLSTDYIARILNVPVEDVELILKALR